MPDVELRADYDRDGRLSGSSTEYDARQAGGAIVLANVDHDGRRLPARVSTGSTVVLDVDTAPKSAADTEPLTLTVRVDAAAVGRFASIVIRIEGANAAAVALLDDRARPVTPTSTNPTRVEFPLALTAGSHTRSLEGRRIPGSPLGAAGPALSIVAVGLDASGTETELDRGNLRLAPFLVLDDLRPATRLYICDLPDNQPSVRDVRAGMAAARPPPLLVTVPAAATNNDTWLQDQFQVGFLAAPGRSMLALLHMPRLRSNSRVVPGQPNLAAFVRSHFPSTDVGLIDDYWNRRIPVEHLGGTARITFEASQEVERILRKLRIAQRELRDELDRMCREADNAGITNHASCTRIPPPFTSPGLARMQLDDLLSRVTSLAGAIATRVPTSAAALNARVASATTLRNDVDRVMRVSGQLGNELFELAMSPQALRFDAGQLGRLDADISPLHDSLVFGGNVEASPAMRGLPFGKVVIGEGDNRIMDPQLRALFDANEAVQPVVTIDTSWLGVGHVDELMSFLPAGRDRSAILRASHEVAYSLLLEATTLYLAGLPANHPDSFSNWRPLTIMRHRMTAGTAPVTRMLRGRHWTHQHQPNPSDVLLPPDVYRRISAFYAGPLTASNAPFTPGPSPDDRYYPAALSTMDYRYFYVGDQLEFIDEKMRGLDEILEREFSGMARLRVPVLFDWANLSGGAVTSAFTPNLANQQFVNGACLIPKPFGPRMKPDQAADVIKRVLASEGLSEARSLVSTRWFTRQGLDVTDVWVNGDGLLPTSRLANANWLGDEFFDGFPGLPKEERVQRIIRANPGAFTASGDLRSGWRKVMIPEGTIDLFQAYTHAVISALGVVRPQWVDSWSYHLNYGEIHCGTNVLRAPPTTTRWWAV